jgi:hypothetical protein
MLGAIDEAPCHGSLADEAPTLVTYRADKILFAKKYSERRDDNKGISQ